MQVFALCLLVHVVLSGSVPPLLSGHSRYGEGSTRPSVTVDTTTEETSFYGDHRADNENITLAYEEL